MSKTIRSAIGALNAAERRCSRRDFLKLCGILGLPVSALVGGASHEVHANKRQPTAKSDSVLIIGAGAAGMAAGYLLAQQGIHFEILEAASTYGGRLKRTTEFADFPVPLGAEWLHVPTAEFDAIVNDSSIRVQTQTQGYHPRDRVAYVEDGDLSLYAIGDLADRKFVNGSWFDFFERYVVPSVREHMRFNTPIKQIDYRNSQVRLTDAAGKILSADKVIVTVPLKMLQLGEVSFVPALSKAKQQAIADAPVWGGVKVFLEFSEAFYPTAIHFPDSETEEGERLYYNAAYAQKSSQHILGLFAVGAQAKPYQALSETGVRDYILAELDAIFNGAASRSYVKHVVQNWDNEPYIRAAYLGNYAPDDISRTLATSVEGKLFFAGDAYTQFDDWGSVHSATRSARDAVSAVVQTTKVFMD